MTALARSALLLAVARSTTSSNGASSRPASLSLSMPGRVTPVTRAPRCSAAAISGVAASGSR